MSGGAAFVLQDIEGAFRADFAGLIVRGGRKASTSSRQGWFGVFSTAFRRAGPTKRRLASPPYPPTLHPALFSPRPRTGRRSRRTNGEWISGAMAVVPWRVCRTDNRPPIQAPAQQCGREARWGYAPWIPQVQLIPDPDRRGDGRYICGLTAWPEPRRPRLIATILRGRLAVGCISMSFEGEGGWLGNLDSNQD